MIKPELKILYTRVVQESDAGKAHYYLLKNLTKTIFPLTVLNEIEKILRTLRNKIISSTFRNSIKGFRLLS